jgi:cell wall-associated NlpC family hydrolase
MKLLIAALVAGLAALVALAGAGVVYAVVGAAVGADGPGSASTLPAGAAPSTAALVVPPAMLALYQRAATTCPGLPWAVLAAIGTVESDNGLSEAPGVHSGANFAGAEGPMQFEPATFAVYGRPVPPGGVSPPDPYDATDAVFAAARDLCSSGGSGGRHVPAAVFAYDHSGAYVARVLALARRYQAPARSPGPSPPTGATALDWALQQVGTPYVWGGETPGAAFDCSGLVQAAYRAAGVDLPRVAQAQFDAGPALPAGATLEPGDLVFFGGGPGSIGHVGIYAGLEGASALMVDAPHPGADVRVEAFPTTLGAPWGNETFVGATRPALAGARR